jgi:four helix bundle protein
MEDGATPRDLKDRKFEFAQLVRTFVKQLPRTLSNTEDVKQLVRASGSVAANWIEADEALSKKDFLMHVKICRKEAKESRLFLRSIDFLGFDNWTLSGIWELEFGAPGMIHKLKPRCNPYLKIFLKT